MKVAYVFAMPRTASYRLGQMILPQLEAGTHGPGNLFDEGHVSQRRRRLLSGSLQGPVGEPA